MEFPAWVVAAVTAVVAVVAGVAGKRAEKAVRDLGEQAVDYLFNYLVASIAREVSYLFDYNSNREQLKAQLKKLEDARQQRVDEAKRNGDDIQSVESRLTEVNGKIAAAKQLVEHEEEKAKKRCLCGLCPNFKFRYQFSKKAVKEANSIAKLLGLFDSDYKDFESRRGAFDGVMAALKDGDVSIIGVYGMGGVGKTTLVKQVASQAKEEKLFDTVVLVAVTQTNNILNIQNEIAEKLGMELFDEKSCMDVRADRLRERLKKEKNVLIILDDIWSFLDVGKLGVPYGDQHMGCKILMTSRNLNPLQQMGSDKNLAIAILTEEEAWNLFKNMAGDIVERGEVQPTAVEIAKKCGGLPIAIVTLAKALKHKEDLFHWKNALEKLNKPSEDDDVYKAIKLSYTFLAEEVQKTFLLCSLMGHNTAIEDLLIYCRGYGLFRDLDTIQKVRDRVLALVSDLKDSSLLLSSSTPGCFDMHDVVRDVAVSIASIDHHWLSSEKVEVSEDLSNDEIMQACNLISFQHTKVSGLPDELECPNLSFLSMGMSGVNRSIFLFYDERSSLEIPNNFLKGMQKLKALSFAKVQFSSLPFSTDFHLLKTLRTLYLFGCKLDDISIIGELTNLEILNLRGSTFEMLPREIVQLGKLKLLDLSGCKNRVIPPNGLVIPPNVLSGLSRLEELYLYDCFDSWEVVDEGRESPAAGSNASLVELENLSHLTVLEVHVGNGKAMPKNTTFFGKLERYEISIGPQRLYRFRNELETSRMLELSDRGDKMFDDGLLRKVENLHLDDVKDVTNLERISYRELNVGSFSQLRVLRVSKCGRLNNLFSFSIAREFYQLEEIMVSDCQNIIELIAEKKEEETLNFNKLKSLKLSNLPKFVRLCGVQKNISSSRQGRDGSNALCLFNHKVALPVLEVLQINGMENFERLWPNQLADEESFSRLTELRLKGCHKLLNVFPLSMSRRLQRLEKLGIIDCKIVEEIFEEGFPSGVVQAQENIIRFEFPELTKLELVDLPNLKSFYRQIHTINLPSLKKELKVFRCDKVGILFGSSQQEIPINELPLFCLNELYLEELSMGWKDAVKEIFHSQQIASRYFCKLKVVKLLSFPKEMEVFPSNLFKFLTSLPNLQHLEIRNAYFKEIFEEVQNELFQNLRKLEVRCCPNLKDNLVSSSLSFKNLVTLQVEACHGIIKLVTHSAAKSLQQLQEMRISNCLEIEEMIEGSVDDDEGGEVKDEIDFPQLKLLELKNLRKLESFCSSGNYTFQFRSLQTVIVKDCPLMKKFSQGELCTPMLNKVKLSAETWRDEECWLGNLNSTIQEMFKEKKSKEDEDNPSTLEQLTLEWDDEMKEIWHEYGPLQQLPSQYFCTLKVVTINTFPEEMEMFSYHQLFQFLISLPNLHRLVIVDAGKEIFQSEVKLSSALEDQLQELRLESSISIEKPWHGGVPQIRSSTLTVSWCRKLKYLFPSSMVKSFVQLKTLAVSNCREMEQLIILSEGLADEERNNILVFPQLDCLKLHWLPNLRRFCLGNQIEFPSLRKLEIRNCPVLSTFSEVGKNNISMENYHADVPQYLFNEGVMFPAIEELALALISVEKLWHDDGVSQIASFGLLTKLDVYRCHKLKYLFPPFMVESFVQLKTLCVSDCDEMEQLIILSDGLVDEERNNIVLFNQLDCLTLWKLPNLKRFGFENRIEFPSLRKFQINECPVLITSNDVRKNNISMENCHVDVPQFLLNKGLSLPNLEELNLGWNDGMKEICHPHGPAQQLASQFFGSLKVVRLPSFPEEMEIFPSQLFQFLISLPNLQGLEIRNANVKEIFKSPPSALEKVQLKEALFQKLVTLEVSSCAGIKKLVTHWIAKSLVQLQELRIGCCSEIEEIIEGSGDDDDDENGEVKDELIRFPQLKLLKLIFLDKLKSFSSSRNYTFQFPSLQTVIVFNCPRMKMFFQGDAETPMLHKVKLSILEDDEGRWSGSLNSTIEEMFKEKVWETQRRILIG